MTKDKPTLKQVVEQVLSGLDGPISVKELAERVYAIYPTKAKTAMSSFRNCLHYDEQGKNLVYLDKDNILPMQLAMQGVRFRVPVDRHVEKDGTVPIFLFDFFLPHNSKPNEMNFVDREGHSIPVRIKSVKNIWLSENPFFFKDFVEAFDFSAWLKKFEPRRGDSLLVTVQDWENCTYALEYEPHKKKRPREIEQVNHELAGILFDMVESSPRGDVIAFQIIPDAYMKLSNPRGYPGDNWHDVVAGDTRVKFDGFTINYAEDMRPFDRMSLSDDEQLPWIKDTYTKKQADDVYRFKVFLGFNSRIWRMIEIKAGQTFVDLDAAIRDAFGHDTFDHMGGFWKLIPRGMSQKKFREIEIGDINPLGEGTAADLHVGGIDLKPGDLLNYVYDFGDWVEHEVRFEGISQAEMGKSYPVMVEKNKPKYEYCVVCKAEGKETVATLICLQCSSEKELVFVCDDCADKTHTQHYLDEIIY